MKSKKYVFGLLMVLSSAFCVCSQAEESDGPSVVQLPGVAFKDSKELLDFLSSWSLTFANASSETNKFAVCENVFSAIHRRLRDPRQVKAFLALGLTNDQIDELAARRDGVQFSGEDYLRNAARSNLSVFIAIHELTLERLAYPESSRDLPAALAESLAVALGRWNAIFRIAKWPAGSPGKSSQVVESPCLALLKTVTSQKFEEWTEFFQKRLRKQASLSSSWRAQIEKAPASGAGNQQLPETTGGGIGFGEALEELGHSIQKLLPSRNAPTKGPVKAPSKAREQPLK